MQYSKQRGPETGNNEPNIRKKEVSPISILQSAEKKKKGVND